MFPGINFWKIYDFVAGWALSELVLVSGSLRALLFLQDKILDFVWKRLIPIKLAQKLLRSGGGGEQ